MKCMALMLLVLVSVAPAAAIANPDGPVGSIVLVPKYSFTDRDYGGSKLVSTNWVAGVNVLVPAGNYGTVVLKVEGGDVSRRSARPENRARFELSFKLYVPFTGGAKERLKSWDERR